MVRGDEERTFVGCALQIRGEKWNIVCYNAFFHKHIFMAIVYKQSKRKTCDRLKENKKWARIVPQTFKDMNIKIWKERETEASLFLQYYWYKNFKQIWKKIFMNILCDKTASKQFRREKDSRGQHCLTEYTIEVKEVIILQIAVKTLHIKRKQQR